MDGPSFIKMHGLGNDFVVLDARHDPLSLTSADAEAIADRHLGVGCDQLIVMEQAKGKEADVFMRIRNADGSEVSACGNATRCVAQLVMEELGRDQVVVETAAGLLKAKTAGTGRVTVDMGPARTHWREIPLAQECDTLHAPIDESGLSDPVCTSMGNPHATFFVENAESVNLPWIGPVLEHHPFFPERANIGIVQVLAPNRLRFRVWERGTGITIACGTGACAALVGAARRGLTGRWAEVICDGGSLEIEWLANGHVLMTGPVATSFKGRLDPSLIGG